jgi:hypothetical protein
MPTARPHKAALALMLRLKDAEPKGLVIITIAVWRSCATGKKKKQA